MNKVLNLQFLSLQILHCSQFTLSLQKDLEYGNKTLSYRNTDI